MNENVLENIPQLQAMFDTFLQHRKKIKSLENFSCSHEFVHKNYLGLMKNCIRGGFLDDMESNFLDHMLKKYELNYLDWSHRTPWLKEQIFKLQVKAQDHKYKNGQIYFDFDKKQDHSNIPVHILPEYKPQRVRIA